MVSIEEGYEILLLFFNDIAVDMLAGNLRMIIFFIVVFTD